MPPADRHGGHRLVRGNLWAEGWSDVERFGRKKREWFARFLELPNGIPSHDTFRRVFVRLDTSEFYACLQRWIRSRCTAISDHGVRLDGKTLRHAFDTAAGKDALHLLNAWSSDLQVCLGQVAVDEGSNEITAVPKLLDLLELTGAVVTLDAMHCQKETAQALREVEDTFFGGVYAGTRCAGRHGWGGW